MVDQFFDIFLGFRHYLQEKPLLLLFYELQLIFPYHLFRAELLKSLKYPEISYRKYCDIELNNLERKTNRAFVGLSLRNNVFISHSQLSQFRTALTFSQMVNVMVYVIHLFLKSGKLGSDSGESAHQNRIVSFLMAVAAVTREGDERRLGAPGSFK